jgi:hypothetical protein
MFVAAFLVLVSGFPLMSGGFRKAAATFLALGVAMLVAGRQPFEVWVTASASMTNIIAIVAVMQTFSMPIRLGDYDVAIRSWMSRRFKAHSSLFLFTTLATHILTSFLNLGAIPVVISLFGEALRRRIPQWRRFFSSAMTRGYVLSALWSPGAVNLYLVVQVTGLSWSRLFLPGFLLAIAGMAMSSLLENRRNEFKPGSAVEEEAGTPATVETAVPEASAGSLIAARRGNPFDILAVAAAFVLVMILLEALHIGASSGRMVLAGALVSMGWLALLSKRPGLLPLLKGYLRDGLLKTADIAPFFVAMGIFSVALENSGAMDLVDPILKAAAGFLGPATVVFIGILVILCSLVGLHPFITIVLFGKILSHAHLPIPILTIGLSLAVGGAASYMISPFAGIIMTVSRLIGAKASDVAVRWNWKFSLLFFAMGMASAFAWGAIFG